MILFLALLLDWFLGDPDVIWRRIPHPVTWFGKLINFLDSLRSRDSIRSYFTDDTQRDYALCGLLIFSLLILSVFISIFVYSLGSFYWIFECIIVLIFLASRSLFEHVTRVFESPNLESSRAELSNLVGRDTSDLDESGVSVATIESLAENFSDGVIAPIFWYLLLGLPGLIFYKAINTSDSMIGHRTPEYEHFGRPVAILDDIMNWPAARLTAMLVGIVSVFTRGSRLHIFSTIMRDASTHASPNAGWPESAFAASLDICLGGARHYADHTVTSPYLNASGRRDLRRSDISSALTLYRNCCYGLLAFTAILGVLTL